ncbi:MAG: 1,4-alpha-glucan branching protein GlgB [Nitrospirota bacterium]
MPPLRTHIEKLMNARHCRPFDVLGPRLIAEERLAVRAFLPGAREAWVLHGGSAHPMQRMDGSDLFEAAFPLEKDASLSYRIRVRDKGGGERTFHDPYSFAPLLSDFDLHLIREGTHHRKYEKLGAHIREVDGIRGVHFALWAPSARGVSVVGDFNRWDGRCHPMCARDTSGIWELFVPGLGEGDLYKFEVHADSGVFLRSDPYGFYCERRPNTASVVWDLAKYSWGDRQWMEARGERNWPGSPVTIYEVHLGSWMRREDGGFLTYRELARVLVDYVTRMGYTHVELLPVMEHPLDASWGYQSLGYFAVTSRFGTPEDFMFFVDHCHQNGVGVIVDWVPAHFPKDAHGLAFFDGTFLYEHAHPFQREHMDWGTHIFNYGRTEVASFLLNSALFWLEKYHIDGLRVDAVASMLYLDYSRKAGRWIPNKYGGNENLEAIAFIKKFNELCHTLHPGVLTIAEESTAWPMVTRPPYMGGLGFSMKWNMGWMHDVLEYFGKPTVHRKYHHHNLTFGFVYAFQENFVLVLSHDEVVHGKRSILSKMPGDMWQKFANVRLLYGFMYGHPGKKMLFMGGEIGQWNEWSEDRSVEWDLLQYEPHRKLQRYVQDLNHLLRREPALYEVDFDHPGFEWIDFSDADTSVVAFLRKAREPEDFLVFVFNFTEVPRLNYRIGVPRGGPYREILNSDAEAYWGSNVGNSGWAHAEEVPMNQWPFSLSLTLPPLGMLVLAPYRKPAKPGGKKKKKNNAGAKRRKSVGLLEGGRKRPLLEGKGKTLLPDH